MLTMLAVAKAMPWATNPRPGISPTIPATPAPTARQASQKPAVNISPTNRPIASRNQSSQSSIGFKAATLVRVSLSNETGSGDIEVKVPPTTGAEVDLDTGSGDIDLGGLSLQVRRIAHDHVSGTLGDGKGRLSVETGSGNVHLEKL